MGVTTYTCIGGTNLDDCKDTLLEGRQIVVGTVGRIMNMMKEDEAEGFYLDPATIKTVALDEADKILTGEFSRDLNEVS